MQLPITGQAYEHPSQDVNYQRCVNLFPTAAGPEGREQTVLLSTPGLKELIDCSGTEVRALIKFDETIYAVVNSIFYEITVNEDALTATKTQRGVLISASGPVSWARNPTQIMLVDGTTNGYIFTVSTNTFAEITDPDFTGGETVVFLDSYFIYNSPNSALMYATAINDGTSVDALDVTTAEGKPDDLVGLAADKREIWAFGKDSVEIWYNAANPTAFPLSRRGGAFIDQGCAAKGSIVNFDNSLMWMDDRGYIVRAEGYSPVIVSTEAINEAIRTYDKISDARAYTYNDGGHLFYVISFPTPEKTWVYDAFTQAWHERAYYDSNKEFVRHQAQNHVTLNQLHLVGSHNTGQIFIMSRDYYSDAGDPIHRLRVSPHHGLEFNQIGIDCLEIHIEAGKGLSTGTGSDPQVMMRYSNDGGYTWSHELVRSAGKIGEYSKRIRWNRLGTAREWLFEFRFTDPIPFTLIDASVDISQGIGT